MTLLRLNSTSDLADPLFESMSAGEREVLSEETFKRMIATERKRTERSKEPFLLMLLEAGKQSNLEKNARALDSMISVLLSSTRETDVIGWYKDRTTVGAIFTGLAANDKNSILSMILGRVSVSLRDELTFDQLNQVSISFHFFPDDWDHENVGRPSNPMLYPDLHGPKNGRRSQLGLKRMTDIAGGLMALAMCSPVMLAIAIGIKLTSKGPVFFKQKRVGQYGQSFTFLKFRSMYVNNDNTVHREFVAKLIASEEGGHGAPGKESNVYKIKNDKRVTPLGKILRRTSLDELPQFINVLHGEMSLVGPRPAIPYELANYKTWHRRRVLEVKPGITGLWQVTGRSRVKFDDMVRLDLRYATSWSPWLDVKILMRTPMAVIKGSGAF